MGKFKELVMGDEIIVEIRYNNIHHFSIMGHVIRKLDDKVYCVLLQHKIVIIKDRVLVRVVCDILMEDIENIRPTVRHKPCIPAEETAD